MVYIFSETHTPTNHKAVLVSLKAATQSKLSELEGKAYRMLKLYREMEFIYDTIGGLFNKRSALSGFCTQKHTSAWNICRDLFEEIGLWTVTKPVGMVEQLENLELDTTHLIDKPSRQRGFSMDGATTHGAVMETYMKSIRREYNKVILPEVKHCREFVPYLETLITNIGNLDRSAAITAFQQIERHDMLWITAGQELNNVCWFKIKL